MSRLTALLLFVSAACSSSKQSNRYALLEIVDDAGNQRTTVDFGRVSMDGGVEYVLIANGGNQTLTVSGLSFTQGSGDGGVFGFIAGGVPFEVEPATRRALGLRFVPATPGVRIVADAVFLSNAEDNTQVLQLSGTGLSSVLVSTPSTADFQDVYLGESKTVSVSLLNVGSKLVVLGAPVAPVFDSVTASDLTGVVLQPGGATNLVLTFTPDAGLGERTGSLDLGVGAVPVRARVVAAVPLVCFGFRGGEPRCANDELAVHLNGDAGAVFLRNDGNVAVSYSMVFAGCLSDGGVERTTSPTRALPQSVTDPRPWETAPLAIQAVSGCVSELQWSRSGDSRSPTSMHARFESP